MGSPSALTTAVNICRAQDKDVLGKPQPLLTTVTNETPNQSGDIFDPWQHCSFWEGNSWKKSIQCYKTLSVLLLLTRRTASARQRRQKMQSQDRGKDGKGWAGVTAWAVVASWIQPQWHWQGMYGKRRLQGKFCSWISWIPTAGKLEKVSFGKETPCCNL